MERILKIKESNMAKTTAGRKQHRSMRGRNVDMDLLRKRNELTPAVGNVNVNARGDELGPGGKIIKQREDVVKAHYDHAGRATPSDGVVDRPKADNTTKTTATTTETKSKSRPKTKKTSTISETELTASEKELLEQEEEEDQWIEDSSGNFVPKEK